jgi:outer membrane protein TolC
MDSSQIQPMLREVLTIDLPVVLRTALAENLDILRAHQDVEASRGLWESAVGSALPAVLVNAPFEHVDGTVRAVDGALIGAGFNTFQLYTAARWITNPGQVIYQIIASRKRLIASEHEEQAVVLSAMRQAAVGFYDLALAQTRVSTAQKAVAEAEELLRVDRLRIRAGTGVPADDLRAEARLAEFQQDLVRAVNGFYQASVALSLTLRLDSSVTLVPSAAKLTPVTLVRPDLPFDVLLELAVIYRPDLKSVREFAEQAAALRGATWWGSWGPQFQVGYQFGGITGHANNVVPGQGIPNNLIVNPLSDSSAFHNNPVVNGFIKEFISRGSTKLAGRGDQTAGFDSQEQFLAGVGWRFTASAFGDLRTAGAVQERAAIDAQRLFELVRAQIVLAVEASKTQSELAGLARRQVVSADEALRLTLANLQAGTMTTLDVLQAQDAANQARLRHADAIVGYNQAQINLLASIGLLDESTLLSAP